jgi:hypothetical protein
MDAHRFHAKAINLDGTVIYDTELTK